MNLNAPLWQNWRVKGIHALDATTLQTLWVFPLSFFALSVWFDVIYLASNVAFWAKASFGVMTLGLAGAFLSAPLAWLEWHEMPRKTAARRAGLWFGLTNTLVLVLFAGSWVVRSGRYFDPNYLAITYSFLASLFLVAAAWLGGTFAEKMKASH